jgi:hypothetical protein
MPNNLFIIFKLRRRAAEVKILTMNKRGLLREKIGFLGEGEEGDSLSGIC